MVMDRKFCEVLDVRAGLENFFFDGPSGRCEAVFGNHVSAHVDAATIARLSHRPEQVSTRLRQQFKLDRPQNCGRQFVIRS